MSQKFLDCISAEGTAVFPCAPGAHWQRGVGERHGDIFEHKFEKVVAEKQPRNRREWEICLLHTRNAKNELTSHHGFSPCQHVFGRKKRSQQELLDKQRCVISSGIDKATDMFSRSQESRTCARISMLEKKDAEAFRDTLDSKYRPTRSFARGDRVAYWRAQARGSGFEKGRPHWFEGP